MPLLNGYRRSTASSLRRSATARRGPRIGSVGLLRVTQRHLRHPHRSLSLVDAVPDPTSAGNLVLPLGKSLVPYQTIIQLPFQLCRSPRVGGAVCRPCLQSALLGSHEVRHAVSRPPPLLLRSPRGMEDLPFRLASGHQRLDSEGTSEWFRDVLTEFACQGGISGHLCGGLPVDEEIVDATHGSTCCSNRHRIQQF